MTGFKKISYYDLRAESLHSKLPSIIGRREELARLTRIINRRMNNNCLIVAPSGAGKTTLIRDWIDRICQEENYQELQFIQFETNHLNDLADTIEADPRYLPRYLEALATLPPCILFIDDFGHAGFDNSNLINLTARLYTDVLKKPGIRVVFSLQPHEYAWLQYKHPSFLQFFETVILKDQT